jgi:hypothetical protein
MGVDDWWLVDWFGGFVAESDVRVKKRYKGGGWVVVMYLIVDLGQTVRFKKERKKKKKGAKNAHTYPPPSIMGRTGTDGYRVAELHAPCPDPTICLPFF